MKKSVWHRDSPGPGRHYFLPKEIHYKYDEKEEIIDRLVQGINEFVHISPTVRILTDSKYADSERSYLEIPYEYDKKRLLTNVADIIYRSLIGHYISADPKTNHFGISNWLLEGNVNSFLNRELERVINQFRIREDMMGRVTRDSEYEVNTIHKAGENFFFDTLNAGMDITIGYMFTLYGSKINSTNLFVPLDCGDEVIQQVFYNLDSMLAQTFSSYDELNSVDYLKITNTLIFKEVVDILKRSKSKEHTRKKILNGLSFNSILTNAEPQLYGRLIGDTVFDTLNHVDNPRIKESSDRSRTLFNDFMIKTTEITNNSVNISELSLSAPSGSEVPSKQSGEEKEKVTTRGAGSRRGRSEMRRDDLQEL